MFASQTTKQMTFGDHVVIIGKLSALHLENAQMKRMQVVAPLLATLPARESERTEEDAGSRYAMYDRQLVLTYGVRTIDGKKASDEQISDLDQPTSEALFTGILDLTFESGEARKKD